MKSIETAASKAVAMAELFLERRGYRSVEVLDGTAGAPANLVATDPEDGALVFVEVLAAQDGEGFPDSGRSGKARSDAERAAAAYLAANATEDVRVRFDAVAIVELDGSGRAFVRHHIGRFA